MVATLAVLALRAIAGAMFAAGMASFVALVVIRPFSEGAGEAITALLTGPFVVFGAACLLGAIVMTRVMPPRPEIVRQVPPAGPVPATVVWLLIALALVAAMEAPALWAWGQFGVQQVLAVIGDPDPMGFWIIPVAIVSASPVIGALTVLTCAATSVLGITARATVTTRVLAAGTALQAGLVVAGYVMRYLVSSLRDAAQPLLSDAEAAQASALFDTWFTRHDLAATNANYYLLAVAAGYVAACMVSASPAAPATQSVSADETFDATAARLAVAPAGDGLPVPNIRAAWTPGPRSSAASVFLASSLYSVRPRIHWLEFLSGRHWEYVFETIPPAAGGRLSFSWHTGVLSGGPHGTDVLRISPATRPGRFITGDYSVHDADARDLGRLVRRSSDWELQDPAGQTLAYVLEVRAAAGSGTYVVRAAGQSPGPDVCRATWGKEGLTIHSAELQLEFLPGVDQYVDRALLMAITPILEQQARLKSERYT